MESTERYDVILLGTGVIECILACLLVKEGRKVLQLDRERFIGGANGSISSFEELQKEVSLCIPNVGGEWNVDLIPKLFVGSDRMIKLLGYVGVKPHTKPIQRVYFAAKSELFNVPNSELQVDVCNYIPQNEKGSYKKLITQAKASKTTNFNKASSNSFQESYNLGSRSNAMLLHGMVYNGKGKNAVKTLNHLQRFCEVKHYQPTSVSYPSYGIGDILQALQKSFSTSGGRCMLNRPIHDVKESGGMVFVTAKGLSAMARFAVGDPSYFASFVKPKQKIIRCLCVLDHSITGTDKASSSFITIPGVDYGRKNDIHICQIGSDHNVSPNGYFLVHISTIAETSVPKEEIQSALEIIEKTCIHNIKLEDMFAPEKEENKLLISSSYDVSMNWESVVDDILRLYERVTGKPLSIFKT